MKKTQVQRNLSLRCKIKAEHVELCIIENSTGAIQYECIPINFDFPEVKSKSKDYLDNATKEVKLSDVEVETEDVNVTGTEGGNE